MKNDNLNNEIKSLLENKKIESKCKVLSYFGVNFIQLNINEEVSHEKEATILTLDEIVSMYKPNKDVKEEIEKTLDTLLIYLLTTKNIIEANEIREAIKDYRILKSIMLESDFGLTSKEIMENAYNLFIASEVLCILNGSFNACIF